MRVILLLSIVVMTSCDHLMMGSNQNRQLIHHEVSQYNSIPFMKRVKSVFYSSPDQRIINAIVVFDNKNSKATATVTAGGIGYTYVNIRMKSVRGDGLDYDIGIYS